MGVSENRGSVIAFDALTGEEHWRGLVPEIPMFTSKCHVRDAFLFPSWGFPRSPGPLRKAELPSWRLFFGGFWEGSAENGAPSIFRGLEVEAMDGWGAGEMEGLEIRRAEGRDSGTDWWRPGHGFGIH